MGRRWGKSILGTDLAVDPLLDGLPVAWFSPTYKSLLDVWQIMRTTLKPITSRVSVQDRRIELVTGGVFEMWTLDDVDAGRGRKYARIIIDEAAMVKNLMAAWSASIRPTLTDLKGDAWFLSTPKGRNGFWQLYQMGMDPTKPDWAAWQMPTSTNPYIDKAEIEAARELLPELTFEQEYLAIFLEGQGSVFRNIAACMNAPETTPAKHRGHRIVAGCDWAKQHDYSSFSFGCVNCRCEVERDRFNKIDYAFQVQRLKVLCEKWQPQSILTELNSIGIPVFEALERMGLPVVGFETTGITKPPLIENLALALERAEWQFQADPVWTGELEAYERTVSPVTGRSSYSAPQGLNDDTVISRALMVWESAQYRQPEGMVIYDEALQISPY